MLSSPLIYHHQNPWGNTCGLMLVVKAGGLDEPKQYKGYTHLAEHLVFSGTKKISREQLQEKFASIFNRIQATTSRKDIKLFCFFDLSDFDEVIFTLKEMFFDWQCPADCFTEEKKMLLEESKEYWNSYERAKQNTVLSLLTLPQNDILLSPASVKKLDRQDIRKAKKYWNYILKNCRREVVTIGKLTNKQQQILADTFAHKDNMALKNPQWNIAETHLDIKENIIAFWYKSSTPHLFDLLLDRIFYWRWQGSSLPFDSDYDYMSLKDYRIFFFYDRNKLKKSREIKQIFLNPIDENEFNWAKQKLLIQFNQTFDVVNVIESLHWFAGFADYSPLFSANPKEAYHFFEKLEFEDFSSFLYERRDFGCR